jgi:predicted SprT family Zn-dependent metalloprotease
MPTTNHTETKTMTTNKPTTTQAASFQDLYDAFNLAFFGGTLALCFLNFSRKSKAYGFFAPERWTEGPDGERIHEISINPSYLSERSAKQTASTLLHEMVHFWQLAHGTPGRRGYHNAEFANKMAEVGLITSRTGKPGGKRTGDRMTHYIEEGGAFDTFWAGYQGDADALFPLQCQEGTATQTKRKAASNASKTKYACPCGTNIWGKPGLVVACGVCCETFAPVVKR